MGGFSFFVRWGVLFGGWGVFFWGGGGVEEERREKRKERGEAGGRGCMWKMREGEGGGVVYGRGEEWSEWVDDACVYWGMIEEGNDDGEGGGNGCGCCDLI